ncbi:MULTISPECIES: protein phosphatase CheZ [unclassified Massilia]|uniref:protein phosphatase CheZ n=1 Tax=unclassified Massilia TaxID=2609279 RepID=UPI00178667D2|nr:MULTISPECIES: protein phosphatase CheZ [unclassified Massilia]MBD8530446.1 protein phosphatase CheZ [Massilia sp. CFBP 13647]MBD8674256.1 protein phosphatase CheZ [Massilia sp. CFBP 13721]
MVEPIAAVAVDGVAHDEVLVRVGHMTRALHDSLRGLGLDKLVEKAASDIPDARDRLDYVARLSEQAARRVLDATDTASPLQDAVESRSAEVRTAWQALLDADNEGAGGEADWRALAERTVATMAENERAATATRAELMNIMLAQDFQDLTGQVIGKITSIAQDLEKQLVQVLIDFAPSEIRRELDSGLLNGPQIKPENNTDVVANQGQVDDLLDSLGF